MKSCELRARYKFSTYYFIIVNEVKFACELKSREILFPDMSNNFTYSNPGVIEVSTEGGNIFWCNRATFVFMR